MILKKISLYLILYMLPGILIGQQFFRVEGEYSQKLKTADGISQLYMGKFFYDINTKKLLYNNIFPQPETWFIYDTSIYQIENNRVISQKSIMPINEYSYFHMILTNQLDDYGLNKTAYKLENVEYEDEMVISTWKPPLALIHNMSGLIKIAKKEGQIHGIVFYSKEGEPIRKQFFENYKNVQGVLLPLKIVEITIVNGRENYQITEYKNIQFNVYKDDQYYNYTLPY